MPVPLVQPQITPERLERFRLKFVEEPNSGCWLWVGGINEKGYGVFWNGDRLEKAHRFALRSAGAPIPPLADVCHKCDNPACVNPGHLYVGCAETNVRDMLARGRHRFPVKCGELNPAAKLTLSEVEAVRRLCASGVPQRQIAALFGVSQTAVYRVNVGKTWERGNAYAISASN